MVFTTLLPMDTGRASMGGRTSIAAIGALLAVVLQVVLAPNIAIFGTTPNFVIAFCVVVAMLLPGTACYVIVFCLGLVADLFGFGPVGALPFILLLCAFLADRAQSTFGNGTLFVSCLIVVAFILLVHFLHAAFMLAVTSSYTASEAFLLIAIPQSLYDCVLAVLLYVLLRRVFNPGQASMANVGPLAR